MLVQPQQAPPEVATKRIQFIGFDRQHTANIFEKAGRRRVPFRGREMPPGGRLMRLFSSGRRHGERASSSACGDAVRGFWRRVGELKVPVHWSGGPTLAHAVFGAGRMAAFAGVGKPERDTICCFRRPREREYLATTSSPDEVVDSFLLRSSRHDTGMGIGTGLNRRRDAVADRGLRVVGSIERKVAVLSGASGGSGSASPGTSSGKAPPW